MTTSTKDPLATLFCSMYSDTGRATHMLQRCGVGAEHVNPRQAASVFWTEAFALADRLGLLPKLVALALADKSVAAFHWQLRAAWEEREKTEKKCAESDTTVADDWPPARIAEALERCERATPDWIDGSHVEEPRALASRANPHDSLLMLDRDGMAIFARAEDCAFAVAARADLPSALRAIKRLSRPVLTADDITQAERRSVHLSAPEKAAYFLRCMRDMSATISRNAESADGVAAQRYEARAEVQLRDNIMRAAKEWARAASLGCPRDCSPAEKERRMGRAEKELLDAVRASSRGESRGELDESTSYGWARQALRPVQDVVELHRYEQALDKVASAVREAWAHRKLHAPTSATVDRVTERELAATRALLTEAATTLGEDAHLVHSAVDVFERLATEVCALRSDVARMPGLEQANREAHQAIANAKTEAMRLRGDLAARPAIGADTAFGAPARERLSIILPHLRAAVADAAKSIPGGQVLLAVIAKSANGSGRIACDFESETFLSDLETLVRGAQ